jgi:Chaperone of endosialidase
MKRLILATLFIVLVATIVHAQLTPSNDAYTNTGSPAVNFGAKPLLDIQSASQNTYIQFDLSSIPSGYTGSNIAKATLKLFVNTVTDTGNFNVNLVNGTWSEDTITSNFAPVLGNTIAVSIPLSSSNVHDYILIDITQALQAWLDGQPNDGIALVANSPLNATFDSKESTTQSHPPELDVVFAGDGTITGISTASGSGLIGGGTSGNLNLALTNACAAKQILQWSGSAWTCAAVGTGTITGVTAGKDLTGGGASGNVTLNVDTTTVPQLATANTFTGNQTVSGNLSATGVVTGSSYQIGSNLFAFGSFTNQSAFFGFAGNSTMSGASNTASGYSALSHDTSGDSNTANGRTALSSNTEGYYNTATGAQALFSNTTGYHNTANGTYALSSSTSGFMNTAMGAYGLENNTTGTNNTASGEHALDNNTSGGFNTGLGSNAGKTADLSNMTASDDTFVGANSAPITGTLANATAIGANAEVAASNSLVLGSINGVNGATADTNIGIGTTAPTARLHIGNSGTSNPTGLRIEGPSKPGTGALAASFGGYGDFDIDAFGAIGGRFSVKENGDITIGNTAASHILTIQQGLGPAFADAWMTWSSRRWKTNIQPLHGALAKVERLRGVSYDLKDSGRHQIGVIAEEVGAVVPEVVTWENNGKDAQGVDYARLTALLIEATKEQQALIHQQQEQIHAQQARMNYQEVRIGQLDRQVRAVQTALNARSRAGLEVRRVSTTPSPIYP